ncbi:calcium-binding protein [Neptuniibacter sp. QD37_11]|uniref:calcium-binding protein n=1 Tax=Neptuniibacter sp. QD37_11 TaxID=3398209 RepID=UPI0039F56ACA
MSRSRASIAVFTLLALSAAPVSHAEELLRPDIVHSGDPYHIVLVGKLNPTTGKSSCKPATSIAIPFGRFKEDVDVKRFRDHLDLYVEGTLWVRVFKHFSTSCPGLKSVQLPSGDILLKRDEIDAKFMQSNAIYTQGTDRDDQLKGVILKSNLMDGLKGDDRIHGGIDKDVLRGDHHSDWLFGHRGADVLIGGLGDDYLFGGKGKDEYVISLGDGTDYIFDVDTDYDYIKFEEPINHENMVFKKIGLSLHINYNPEDDSDRLVLSNWFKHLGRHIEDIKCLKNGMQRTVPLPYTLE